MMETSATGAMLPFCLRHCCQHYMYVRKTSSPLQSAAVTNRFISLEWRPAGHVGRPCLWRLRWL